MSRVRGVDFRVINGLSGVVRVGVGVWVLVVAERVGVVRKVVRVVRVRFMRIVSLLANGAL